MSVEQIVAVEGGSPVPATINFYYEIEKLFNSVSIRTAYRAKMTKDQQGESQLDDIQLTSQERSIFLEFLEMVTFDTFGELFKITESVKEPIFFNINYTPLSPAVAVLCCGAKILDNENYSLNILQNLDKKIENCLRYGTLREWAISTSQLEDAKINEAQYKEYIRKVKNLSFELRKPLMT